MSQRDANVRQIRVAEEIANYPGLTIMLLGGLIRPAAMSVVGNWSETLLNQINIGKAFVGAKGFTLADWSPDGRRIAFVSERDGQSEIYVMNADGTDQRRLTFNLGAVRSPRWSPDGKFILFASDLLGDYDLFVIRADGSAVYRLTDHAADDYAGDWQP